MRAYRPDPLAPGTLELLVTAAQSASTSSNLQTWSVVAVEDAARRARIAGWCGGQRHIVEAPLFLAWIADLARLQAVAEAAGLPSGALDHLELFLVAVIDAALAAQNAVVAAESLGLGTVYIGALRNRPEEVARELKLPPRTFAVFGLVVGWPDPAQPAAVKPRLSQAAILHREHYSDNGLAGAITDYDHTMGAFYASQQMEPQSWTKHSLGRVAGGESIGNRARLREILGRLGFPLR
ncbi:MAG: NADPH-dependent oxidoreductase [Verrucomicrobiota bacterium]